MSPVASTPQLPELVPCEIPVLRLGLAGFAREEEAMLAVELAWQARQRRVSWEAAPLAQADAWFVNGSRLRGLPDRTWRVVPAQPTEHAVRIDPAEADCPVAVSLAPQVADLNPVYRFDLDSPESIRGVLEQLEGWLRPLTLRFALASQLIDNQLDLAAAAYHVTVEGKLYAVISRRAGVGVWPIANPRNLARAVWHKRPGAADVVPASFMTVGLQEALWQYATRTARDILPAHYRRKRLYLRLPPPVPTRLISDRCLLLVRELGRRPGTFQELVQRTGTHAPRLAQHLAALYVVGSVTANEKRLSATPDPSWNSSLPAGRIEVDGAGGELTVRLRARHRAEPAADPDGMDTIAGWPADMDERSRR